MIWREQNHANCREINAGIHSGSDALLGTCLAPKIWYSASDSGSAPGFELQKGSAVIAQFISEKIQTRFQRLRTGGILIPGAMPQFRHRESVLRRTEIRPRPWR
ncbi:MAG: hypothetical protein DME65_06825 [Verrucomicrobia bacterium]|nr:MAG: hypothetical protein DME65_06825 [Verrucomicrobiota bacterium]